MFANRIRNAALSLAVAALAATTALSTIAAAAPADSLPLSSGGPDQTMVDPSVLKLPDISARAIGKHLGGGNATVYEFEIKNNGRGVAHNVVPTRYFGLRDLGSGDWDSWNELPAVNLGDLQPGEVRHLDVNCVPKSGTYCSSGVMEVPFLPGEIVRNNNAASQQ